MEKQGIIAIAVALVAVVGLCVAGAYVLLSDNDDDENEITFLVQDNEGVYFWIEGEGDTVMEAFEDAVKENKIPFEKSVKSYGEGISSLFGLEMKEVTPGNWAWWSQYTWTGSAWESASLTMEKISYDDSNGYFAVVYGDGTNAPMATPDKAKVDDSDKGVAFLIQSNSGMYFTVHASGKTVMKAFENAVEKFQIPFEKSVKSYGEGISSLFGLEMREVTPGNWAWWSQYTWTGSAWESASLTMEKISPSDTNDKFAIVYGDGTVAPVTA